MTDPAKKYENLPRLCRSVREVLHDLDHAGLAPTGMTRRVTQAHLKHCKDCAAEMLRQRAVDAGLASLRERRHETPPPGLLQDLLASTGDRTLRTRVAEPARGAISGARPKLTIAMVTAGAVAGTGLGWAAISTARKLRHRPQ